MKIVVNALKCREKHL